MLRWSLDLLLPLAQLVVWEVLDEREVGQREDVVDHLMIASQHFQQVILDSCRLGDLVKKPRGAVLAVNVLVLVGHPASPPCA